MNKYSYTNTQKDEMMNTVIRIAEEITNESWESDGAYAINVRSTMAINIYDNMDNLTWYLENELLEKYVSEQIKKKCKQMEE